jgi:hypothetical protein
VWHLDFLVSFILLVFFGHRERLGGRAQRSAACTRHRRERGSEGAGRGGEGRGGEEGWRGRGEGGGDGEGCQRHRCYEEHRAPALSGPGKARAQHVSLSTDARLLVSLPWASSELGVFQNAQMGRGDVVRTQSPSVPKLLVNKCLGLSSARCRHNHAPQRRLSQGPNSRVRQRGSPQQSDTPHAPGGVTACHDKRGSGGRNSRLSIFDFRFSDFGGFPS